MAQFYYVWGLQACGHYARAVEFAHRQLELHGWQANVLTLRLFLALGTAHFEMANLPAMQSVTTIWYKLAAQTSFGLSIGWSLFGLGWLHYQKNELDACPRILCGASLPWPGPPTAGRWSTAIPALSSSPSPAAARPTRRPRSTPSANICWNAACPPSPASSSRSSSAWRSPLGSDTALAWRRATGAAPAGGDFWDQPDLTEVRTLLAAATGSDAPELAQAEALLAESRAYALARNSHRRLIEIGGLQALVSAAQGDAAAARAALEEAVALAAPGGALRLLVDCGPGLIPLLQELQAAGTAGSACPAISRTCWRPLAAPAAASPPPADRPALPPEPPLRQPTPAELFTNREIDVLTLLAQRLGDKEIAAQLVLSPLTVKKHTQRLYRKLGVANRRAAVAEARRLGLI